MSTTPPEGADRPTPAEHAALVHLGVLRGIPAEPAASLVVRVVRTARRQRAVLAPARVVASVASAFGATLTVLLGRSLRRGSR